MQPTRRALLQSIAAAGAGSLLAAPRRPNFVFVLVDDLRYNALSCTGHPFLKTPHIDRIAAEGVNFSNAFVTTSLCSPSRGCFLTGQYAHTHGITDNTNRNADSHKLVTFPKLLHDAGYNTGYVGKWHMGNDDSPRPGFDRWVSFKGQGVYENPPLNIDGQPTKTEGYMTDILSGYAVDFIQQKRSSPFCLYLGHKAVHGPFSPAPRHRDLYAGLTVPRKPNAKDSLDGKPALRRQAQANTNDPVSKQVLRPGGPGDEVILNQLRCIPAIDDGVGRIYDALKQSGQLDDTVFVFTSDNGYLWGEHGLGDKRASYEESIRIPMVARYPRLIRPGSTASESVLNIDIAPTFLQLAGAPVPASMQGVPITPVLQGKARNWRKSFLIEYFEEKQFPRIPSYQAVRTNTHKYTHYTGLEGMDEFYDLQADPGEMNNLINEPSAQEALKSAQAELVRLLKETRA